MEQQQEALLEIFCECLLCGRTWSFMKEVAYTWDATCCGGTRVREEPRQLLFCDEGGPWILRKERGWA